MKISKKTDVSMVYNSVRPAMFKCLIAFSAILMTAFTGCSKWAGDPITQEFTVSGSYTELVVQDAFDVTVSSEVSQITVTAGDNIMSKVKVEMEDNTLKIYLKGWTLSYGSDMKVLLPYNPGLNSVELSGASEFQSPFTLTGTKVEIECSGASVFNGSVLADELDLDLSGSSDATIGGTVHKLDMNISGSSGLEKNIVDGRYSPACTECTCSISGSSVAYIHCDGSISGRVSGSSDLHYTGNASTSGCSSSGSSSITHDVL